MTNEDWSDLTRWLILPDNARQPIENELDLYHRSAESAASPPSETKQNLEHAADTADRLLGLIEGFGPDEHYALVESGEGATPRLDALKLLVDKHAQLTALRDRMTNAAAKLGRGKTGSDASNVRALVKRVSKIIETHTGKPLSKRGADLKFAEELCKVADPPIKFFSLKGAIEKISR
jgi:hypothetical protein